MRPLTLFRAPLKGFCVFRTQLSMYCSKLSTKPSIESRKQLFLLLKLKQYLDKKLVALQQFSSNDNHYHRSFPGFRFYQQSIFENLESTKNFNKLIFQGITTIYLISRAFLSILCIQEKLSKCCSRSSKRTYH